VTLVSESFASFARARCRGLGMPDLRMVLVPHPIADRPREELEDIALARFDDVLAALTRT
jgi:hypothetical protein